MMRTLQDAIECLFGSDRSPGEGPYPDREVDRKKTPIVFDTSDRAGLEILSVYMDDDGVVHVDIGDDKDE